MSFEPKLRRSRQERRTHTHTHSNPKYPTSSRPRNLFEINENQWFWDHFRPADPNLQNLIPWPWPGLPSQPSQPSQPAPKYPTSSRPRNLFEINENQWFWDHFRPAEQNLQNIIPWRAFAHGFLCTCSFTIGLDKPKFSTPCVHPDTCLRIRMLIYWSET